MARDHNTTSLSTAEQISRAAKTSPLVDVATAMSPRASAFSQRETRSSSPKEVV